MSAESAIRKRFEPYRWDLGTGLVRLQVRGRAGSNSEPLRSQLLSQLLSNAGLLGGASCERLLKVTEARAWMINDAVEDEMKHRIMHHARIPLFLSKSATFLGATDTSTHQCINSSSQRGAAAPRRIETLYRPVFGHYGERQG
jgi:hypothetical protein